MKKPEDQKRHVKIIKLGNREGKKYNVHEISDLFGVSVVTIHVWIKAGMPRTGGKGRPLVFDTAECAAWRVKMEQDKIYAEFTPAKVENKMSLADAKLRSAIATALTDELELEDKREQVSHIDDLMVNFTSALVNIRAALISMPSRLAGDLSHQDEHFIARELEKDVTATLGKIIDYDHKYIEHQSESEGISDQAD